MLVPTWMGTKLGGRKPTKHLIPSLGTNLFLEELINIKVILFRIQELFR